MTKYLVALSFYVEESAEDLETAKRNALSKIRYKGNVMHELEATGILADKLDTWREITEVVKSGGKK